MKSKIASLLSILCWLGSSLPSSAQQSTSVSTKIDLVAWGNTLRGLTLGSADKGEKLTALPFSYGKTVRYSGSDILAIYQSDEPEPQRVERPDELDEEARPLMPATDGEKRIASNLKDPLVKELLRRREEEPSLVSLVKLPSNSRHITILLAPASDDLLTAHVINDDPTTLPPGKLRVHNLSPFQLRMKFSGRQGGEIAPGQKVIINANKRLAYELAYQKEDKWKTQENNYITVPEDEQTQLIILKSQNQFFLSSDGSSSGFLQKAILRRTPE